MHAALIPFTADKGGARSYGPVANIILASDDYEPPEGFIAVMSETASIGDLYDGKVISPAPVPDLGGAELEAYKTMLCAAVDARAEDLRNELITPGSGQAMEYQASYAQALAVLGADAAHAADETKPEVSDADPAYALLAATIGIDIDPNTGKPATSVIGVARSVKAAYEAYFVPAAAIKAARMRGKGAIQVASTRTDADAAAAAIVWPKLS